MVALTPPALDRDRFCTVEALTGDADEARVKFSGIDSIAEAEAVAGCWVLARVDDIDLGPMDVAYDDILGREVVDPRYGELGRVAEVLETPANDVWVVDGGAYGEILLPVIPSVVSEIPESGAIEVTLLDGLVEGIPSGGGTC